MYSSLRFLRHFWRMACLFLTVAVCTTVVGLHTAHANVGFQRSNDPLQRGGVRDIATGDFNDDGQKDFAIANDFNGGITVYINDGHGGYVSGATYLQLENVRTVTAGDFDGDGVMDLAAAVYDTPSMVVVLHGNRVSGTFTEKAKIAFSGASASGPVDIQTGDFNGDHKLDIATANSLSDNISLLFGNGDMAFTTFQSVATGKDPAELQLDDLNHDGIDDLLVRTLKTSGLFYIRGRADQRFIDPAQQVFGDKWISAFTLGDVDGDKREDLVVTGTHSLAIYKGYGDSKFELLQTLSPTADVYDVDLADANSDTKLDLLLVQSNPDAFLVFGNNGGEKRFTSLLTKVPLDTFTQQFMVEDLNSDHRSDVLFMSYIDRRVSFATNISQSNSFSLTPEETLFPDTQMNSTSTQQVVLDNGDDTSVEVRNIGFAGTDRSAFDIEASTCVKQNSESWLVLPESNCSVTVRFQPEHAGVHTAILKVATNAGTAVNESGIYQQVLSGNGLSRTQGKLTGLTGTSSINPRLLSFSQQKYRWKHRSRIPLRLSYRTNFSGKVAVILKRCARKKSKKACQGKEIPMTIWSIKPGTQTQKIRSEALRRVRKGTYQIVMRSQEGGERAAAQLTVL